MNKASGKIEREEARYPARRVRSAEEERRRRGGEEERIESYKEDRKTDTDKLIGEL